MTASCFLAVVDIWCVALLLKYCESVARLSGLCVLVATLLPLTLIVTGLAVSNLELVAFGVLVGQGDRSESANDGANGTNLLGTYFRVLASSSFAESLLLSQYACLII